jgi:hypothetical protein
VDWSRRAQTKKALPIFMWVPAARRLLTIPALYPLRNRNESQAVGPARNHKFLALRAGSKLSAKDSAKLALSKDEEAARAHTEEHGKK